MIALQQVGIRQLKAELIPFRVDGTGTASILEGGNQLTLTDNGTGDYTLTLRRPGRRTLVVAGVVPLTAGLSFKITAVSSSAVQIQFDDDTVATDTDFHGALIAYYSPTQR